MFDADVTSCYGNGHRDEALRKDAPQKAFLALHSQEAFNVVHSQKHSLFCIDREHSLLCILEVAHPVVPV